MKYYEVHVNIPKCGYSFAIKSEKELSEKEILHQAMKECRFEEESDVDCVDYIGEISEYDYHTMR